MGPYSSKTKNKDASPPTNRSRKFTNFSWIFFLNGPHKATCGIFEILKIEILPNFQLCLTMSAELLKSKFVRPSVSQRTISEPVARIISNVSCWLPWGLEAYNLKWGTSWIKKNIYIYIYKFRYFRIFLVFVVNMRPCGNKNFKTLLLQI